MNRLVVVSNRVPVPGRDQAGGLTVALNGLMEKRGGLWFGWSGAVDADAESSPPVIQRHGQVDYVTVDLTAAEHESYYSGFANGVLWPLLHTMPELMEYERAEAAAYLAVNARFADAIGPLLRPDDVLWLHDYHLLPLPRLLRARGVANPIGFFLHTPFPTADLIGRAPAVQQMLADLLAADLIGFQTDSDRDNFMGAAGGADHDAAGDDSVTIGSHTTRLGVFPAEIEPREFAATAAAAVSRPAVQRLRQSLAGQGLILGVDRLDPTKGLLQRVAGLRRLLTSHPEWLRRITLLQIAPTSRIEVSVYRELRLALDREAGSVNSDLGDPDWTPLRLVAKAGSRRVIAGYMRLASVGLVTPLRDGMNLVAKEFVAAQDPADPGVLVLSRFAGAARQLADALLVNPHDADEMADAIDQALRMELAERRRRWQGLWGALEQRSPEGWGQAFLEALAQARDSAAGPGAGSSG